MRVHLLDRHRNELITHLPIRGKGFTMDYRTAFVIDFLKRRKPLEYYDHRIAKFAVPDTIETLPNSHKISSGPEDEAEIQGT
jgi:hypothetical protein